MENWLASSPWYGILLWIILYTSDYYLTLYAARGFHEIGHFQFEGSFELTPQYQKDIDAQKSISKRHILLLILYSLLIYATWWLTQFIPYLRWAYLLYLGMFLLVEVAVHLRHLRNIFIVKIVRKNGGVEGNVKYEKQFSYQLSAFEFYTIGVLFLITALLTYSLFFAGGAIMCFGTGFKHTRLARHSRSNPSQAVTNQT